MSIQIGDAARQYMCKVRGWATNSVAFGGQAGTHRWDLVFQNDNVNILSD
jgi:hypothetical protein